MTLTEVLKVYGVLTTVQLAVIVAVTAALTVALFISSQRAFRRRVQRFDACLAKIKAGAALTPMDCDGLLPVDVAVLREAYLRHGGHSQC